jgi:hypothetical protein
VQNEIKNIKKSVVIFVISRFSKIGANVSQLAEVAD